MRKRWLAASAAAVLLAVPDVAVAESYSVDPQGSDSAPGTSERPWRTIEASFHKLEPGDTLIVRGGTYSENVVGSSIRPGSSSSPIVVKAAAGENPVIQGLLWLSRPSHWTLDGIDVTWRHGNPDSAHMVKMTDGSGWTIKNAELSEARSYAALLVAGEPSGWSVRDSCVHDTRTANSTNQDHLIYVNTGSGGGPGLVTRNVLFNAPNGHGLKLAGSGVRFSYNTVHNTRHSVLVDGESHGNLWQRNILSSPAAGAVFRSYRLRGDDDVATENLWHGARTLDASDDGYGEVEDGGGNVRRDPRFDSVGSCSGFRPEEPAAASYGAYAP